jgi:hypothetical protein
MIHDKNAATAIQALRDKVIATKAQLYDGRNKHVALSELEVMESLLRALSTSLDYLKTTCTIYQLPGTPGAVIGFNIK